MKCKKKKKKQWKKPWKLNKKISNNYWLPLNIEARDETDSWFTNNFYNTNNSKFIQVENKIKTIDDFIKCRKIIIKPNIKQRKILLLWFEVYNYIYNQTLLHCKKSDFKKMNWKKNRDKIIKPSFYTKDWIIKSKIPVHTLDNAIHDVHKAFKSAMENKKKGNIKYFRLRYKKSTKNKQTICLESQSFSNKNNTFCSSVLGKHINTSYSIKDVKKDSRLIYNKNTDEFILYVPYDSECKNINPRNNFCSLDPGLRTFQTGYCSNGTIKIGINVQEKLKNKLIKMKRLNKKRKKKNKLNKVYYNKEKKITNMIDELHWKTCNYLCKHYNNIFIGKISTKSILSKKNKCLSALQKKIFQRLSHFKFRERLKFKCQEYKTQYKEINESMTTMTCGNCGNQKKMKGEKFYECQKCNIIIDRDYNGARNIFLKSIKHT